MSLRSRHPIARTIISAGLIAGALTSSGSAAPEKRVPTPVLIERAVAAGTLARSTGDLYLAYALTGSEELPDRYLSAAPWEGTVWLLELRQRLRAMPPGPRREAIAEALAPGHTCDGLTFVSEENTAHFHIHYTPIGGGLTIEDYKTALEAAWTTEVGAFGWAAPPTSGAPQYLVVVAPLGPGLFGFVSSTGTVGDNPNTTGWNEGDAQASCMALNSDFSTFPPSTALQALQSTVAHEFNHSIQFGYGALNGPNVPDLVLIEGGATWIEDEVFDSADDNYRYLYPVFGDDLGEYQGAGPPKSPYDQWILFRGITEPYGTGAPGAGEDIMQRFWEITSRNEAANLNALNAAIQPVGADLASAYHAYAVAVKFNRPCGGGYVAPYCLEEGPAYVAARGPTAPHGSIGAIGGSVSGNLPDNYSLNWVTLPNPGAFQVRLKNTSNGGRLRGSVACDTGGQILVTPLPKVVGSGEETFVPRFDQQGCQSTVAVITNQGQTEANPSSSASRTYTVSVLEPPDPTRTRLKVRRSAEEIEARGTLKPPHSGDRMIVTLYERHGKKFKKVDRERPRLKGKRFEAEFERQQGGRCRITARFPGDDDHLASEKSKTFAC